MRDRRLRAWLLALARFELPLRVTTARNRNAFIRAAAESYETNKTVAGWLRTAHEKRVQESLAGHYQQVIPYFGSMAVKQIPPGKSRRIEKKQADYLILASQWINREALRKAKLIAATDTDDVRDAIADGVTEGLGTEQIARNIRKVTSLTPHRAATIARTETHAAATFGSIEAIRQAEQEITGLKMIKVWLATNDDRTRPEHRAMNGTAIGLDEKFTVDGELMDRPGDPGASEANVINCRCALAYEEAE